MTENHDFIGGIESLKSPNEISNKYEAIGLWWAQAVLKHHFDNNPNRQPAEIRDRMNNLRILKTERSLRARSDIEDTIGGFASALAFLVEFDPPTSGRIDTEYHPNKILCTAAALAFMPIDAQLGTTFPWKSFTLDLSTIDQGEKVLARLGESGKIHQIWPLVEAD